MTVRTPEQRLGSMLEVEQRLQRIAAPPTSVPTLREQWRWRAPRWRKCAWTVLAAASLTVAAWRLWPYATSLAHMVAPFSQTQQMHEGMEALKAVDRRGNLDKAADHFSRVLAHKPENAAAAAGMALVFAFRYGSDGQDEVWLKKAAASAQQALQLDEHLALSHVANAWVFDSQGLYAQALRAHEQALLMDPGNFFAWYGKTQALRHARRYPEALKALALASVRFPKERVFADELGIVHYEQGNYAAAEQAFRHSIALQPDAVTGYANLNAVLLAENRAEEALGVLQQGLQIGPSAKLYGNLGNAYFYAAITSMPLPPLKLQCLPLAARPGST